MALLLLDVTTWEYLTLFLDLRSLLNLYCTGSSLRPKLKLASRHFSVDWTSPLLLPLSSLSKAINQLGTAPLSLEIWSHRESDRPLLLDQELDWNFFGGLLCLRLELPMAPVWLPNLDLATRLSSLQTLKLSLTTTPFNFTLPESLTHLELGVASRTTKLPLSNMPLGLRVLRINGPLDYESTEEEPLPPLDWTHLPLEEVVLALRCTPCVGYEFLPPTITLLDIVLNHASLIAVPAMEPPHSWKSLFPALKSLNVPSFSLTTWIDGNERSSAFPPTITSISAKDSKLERLLPHLHAPELAHAKRAFELLCAEIAAVGPSLKYIAPQVFPSYLGISELAKLCPNLTRVEDLFDTDETMDLSLFPKLEELDTENTIDLNALWPLPASLKTITGHLSNLPPVKKAVDGELIGPGDDTTSNRRLMEPSPQPFEALTRVWPKGLTDLELTVNFPTQPGHLYFDISLLPSTLLSFKLTIHNKRAAGTRIEPRQALTPLHGEHVRGNVSHMKHLTSLDVSIKPPFKSTSGFLLTELPTTLTFVTGRTRIAFDLSVISRDPASFAKLKTLSLCEMEEEAWSDWEDLTINENEQSTKLEHLMSLPPCLTSLEFFARPGTLMFGEDFVKSLPRTLEALKIAFLTLDMWEHDSAVCLQFLPKRITSLVLLGNPGEPTSDSENSEDIDVPIETTPTVPSDFLDFAPLTIRRLIVQSFHLKSEFRKRRGKWIRESIEKQRMHLAERQELPTPDRTSKRPLSSINMDEEQYPAKKVSEL